MNCPICDKNACECAFDLGPAPFRALPAAPVGDDASHYTVGRRWSHIYNAWILAESWNDKEEIASQAARIAELERENKRIDDALLRLHGELDQAYEQIERGERQLAAAQACIVAADAMRECVPICYASTTDEHEPNKAAAAYDAARRAFDEATE